MVMKSARWILSMSLLMLFHAETFAQLSPLHVDGRYMKNAEGEVVVLHGFGQTYSPWFNEQGTKWSNYNVSACLAYNKGLIDDIVKAGWKMDFCRMHMDPYWSNLPGVSTTGENDIHAFSFSRFKTYLDRVFVPMAEYIMSKGMYVVMRPPGVCPENIAVGDAYQKYLLQVWEHVAQHPKLKDNPGVLFELANEPVNILKDGQRAGTEELTKFFQPIVDVMRKHCNNILLVPGLGWQSQYAGFVEHPVTGGNIGYAVHCYPGWYNGGHGDDNVIVQYADFKKGWDEQITPIANVAPVIVTEMDWAPRKYNCSWGKSFTGVAGGEGFGANFKKLCDENGNVGWMLFTGSEHLAKFKDEAPADGKYTFLTDPEACPWPVYHWFQDYARQRSSAAANTVVSVKMDKTRYTVLPCTTKALQMMATFEDGHEVNVAGDALYTVENDDVAEMRGGNLLAKAEGETNIDVVYTDPQGNAHRYQLSVSVSYFPLTADGFNPSIFEKGTFNENTGVLRTGQYGFGGWHYDSGIDLSPYKYLVIQLSRQQSCGASFRLYDQNNYWTEPYVKDFGSGTKVVVDLHNMKDKNGRSLDPSHLYYIGIWTYGSGDVAIKSVFLSDNGVAPSAVLLPDVASPSSLLQQSAPIYNLSGQRVASSSLSPGVYISNGKKFIIK